VPGDRGTVVIVGGDVGRVVVEVGGSVGDGVPCATVWTARGDPMDDGLDGVSRIIAADVATNPTAIALPP
jgi:hypothetical protein